MSIEPFVIKQIEWLKQREQECEDHAKNLIPGSYARTFCSGKVNAFREMITHLELMGEFKGL